MTLPKEKQTTTKGNLKISVKAGGYALKKA